MKHKPCNLVLLAVYCHVYSSNNSDVVNFFIVSPVHLNLSVKILSSECTSLDPWPGPYDNWWLSCVCVCVCEVISVRLHVHLTENSRECPSIPIHDETPWTIFMGVIWLWLPTDGHPPGLFVCVNVFLAHDLMISANFLIPTQLFLLYKILSWVIKESVGNPAIATRRFYGWVTASATIDCLLASSSSSSTSPYMVSFHSIHLSNIHLFDLHAFNVFLLVRKKWLPNGHNTSSVSMAYQWDTIELILSM